MNKVIYTVVAYIANDDNVEVLDTLSFHETKAEAEVGLEQAKWKCRIMPQLYSNPRINERIVGIHELPKVLRFKIPFNADTKEYIDTATEFWEDIGYAMRKTRWVASLNIPKKYDGMWMKMDKTSAFIAGAVNAYPYDTRESLIARVHEVLNTLDIPTLEYEKLVKIVLKMPERILYEDSDYVSIPLKVKTA